MTKWLVSLFITLFLGLWCLDTYAQCVECHGDARQKIFSCRSSASGGSSCATSTGQTQCTLIGVCGQSASGEVACSAKTIGKVLVPENALQSIQITSPLYGDAVHFAVTNGFLGSNYAKIAFFPDYKEREKAAAEFILMDNLNSGLDDYVAEPTDLIELEFEVAYTNSSPSSINITLAKRIDALPASIELTIQRQVKSSKKDGKQWIVTGWNAKW